MKYRFYNEPDEMDLASMFRALADLANEGAIVGATEDGDLNVGAVDFTGCLGTFYEERWVRQLIKHYGINKVKGIEDGDASAGVQVLPDSVS